MLGKNGRPKKAAGVTFYGIAEEVELAIDLFNELRTTIAAMSKLRFGGVYRGDGREYCEGFVGGLFTKIKQEEKRRLEDATRDGGRALVLVQKAGELVAIKQDAAKDWLAKTHKIRLRKQSFSSGATHHNADARSQGRSDGKAHNTSAGRKLKLTSQ